MINDKKNIDQLFEHFKDKEMPYNPESWERMERLLDEQLPVNPKRSKIKRLIPHIIGIGIISSLVIGYFITPYNNTSGESSFDNKELLSQNTPNEPSPSEIQAWATEDLDKLDSVTIKENLAIYHEHFEKNESHKEIEVETIGQNDKPISTKLTAKPSPQSIKKIDELSNEQKKINNQIKNLKDKSFNTVSIEKVKTEEVIKVLKGLTPEITTPNHKMKELKVNNNTYAQNVETGFIYDKSSDTVTKFKMLEKHNTTPNTLTKEENQIPKVDTISIFKVERINYTPLPLTTQIEILELIKNKNERGLASLKNNLSTKSFSIVSSSTHKSQKKSARSIQWFKKHFHESKPQFAYLYFGGNSLIGQQLKSGAHIGLGVGYVISQKWNLNVDFKYTNQFLGQLTFKDMYAEYDVEKFYANEQWEYQGTGKEMIHNYTINQIQNMQLSTYFSYNTESGISLLMGIMGQARLPIAYQKNSEINELDISQISTSGQLFENKNWSVDPELDFKSSFSLGYMVGLQYDINKKWGMQAKVQQSLLHSLKSDLDYLRKTSSAPTVELSLGYYFGRKDKIIYIMDYNK